MSNEERDPHGKSNNEAGAKADAGKNRLGLVLGGFSRALQAVGEVGTYGAEKYTDDGWLDVPDGINRYNDAMYRHLLRHETGEHLDPDTNLMHLTHAAWNILAQLDLRLRQEEAHHLTDGMIEFSETVNHASTFEGRCKIVVDRKTFKEAEK